MKRFLIVIIGFMIYPPFVFAALGAKLPYAAGERFVVTTGYDTPPTHIKKDDYAIDFTQDGCDAYGKPAVAAFSGTAWVVQESGYNGGYGTQLLVLAAGKIVARYAHLIPGSIPVDQGDAVSQGTVVGEIGDTGLVAGTACTEHPGTHIHFAMDTENDDGSFVAKDPEPISGYAGIAAGKWYVSDNALAATKENLAALMEILNSLLGDGVTIVAPPEPAPVTMPAFSGGSASASVPQGTSSASPPVEAGISSLLPAVSSVQNSSSPDIVTSSSVAIANGTSSVPIVSGGGSGGGVSVDPSPSALNGTPWPATSASQDDPSDDTIPACE